jgi:plasmid stability protein
MPILSALAIQKLGGIPDESFISGRGILPASCFAGKMAIMKTTLDLPEQLVREMKLRAVQEGRKLKEVARDALIAGLAGAGSPRRKPNKIVRDKKTGLPVIQCQRAATLTPKDVAEILINQEVAWANDSG